MIKIIEKFDFLAEINEEIKQMIIALNGSNVNNEDIEKAVFSPRIVGQEEDGIIIFTWQLNFPSLASSYIALYNQSTHKSRLIFTQEKAIEIVTASVNTTRTLVAFSVVERKNKSAGDNKGDGDVYKSYIAEVSPQNRVFSLNIEWRTFQKVKFLRERPGYGQHVSRMLFFHHKESIGLYHIPVTEKDNRFVMSMQPSTQQISDQFIWSQFDLRTQRLYILKLIPLSEDGINSTALLTVVEFKEDGEYEYILKLPLPIPFKSNLMAQKPVYYDRFFSSVVSTQSFNMTALSSKAGSFYMCYQHPGSEKGSDKRSDTTSTSSSSGDSFISDAANAVSYTICCIHGGYKVQCSYSYGVDNIDSNARVLFSLFNDYMLVFLPGAFLHLLDIGCEHEPVHNLLLNNDMGLLPQLEPRSTIPLFSTIIYPAEPVEGLMLFENNHSKGYMFELSRKGLLKYFNLAKPATRLAILHASMHHFDNKRVTQSILKHACRDSANTETADIFNEYLVLAAYLQMKQIVVSPLDLKIFPFTSQDVYRGQVERRENGERLLYLQYKEFSGDIVTQFQRILRKRKGAFWSNVFLHLSYEVENRNKRFPLKQLRYAAVNAELHPNPRRSLIREKSTELEKLVSAPSLRNLDVDPIETESNEFRNAVCAEKIVSYVTRIFGRETKSKAQSMCREYSVCRIKVIAFLWKIILKSLHLDKIDDLMSTCLNEPITENDSTLFQLLERLSCLVDQLCYPTFPYMKRFLCYYGFRCLSSYQFFQYVDACIFELDEEFVRRIVFELSNDPKELEIKLKIVSYLTKEDAHSLLKGWDNEYGNKYLAKNIMAHVPSDNIHFNSGIPVEDEEAEDFVPLRTLLESCKLLGKKTGFLRSATHEMYEADIGFVGQVALANTNSLKS